jgi:asparagine synthase (glutamine-hydrolysing)
MCGILGLYLKRPIRENDRQNIISMAKAIDYRGPDEYRMIESERVILASCRLAIIDLKLNRQPVYNRNKDIFGIFNGEIFNYLELRAELIKKGHSFQSNGDSEVIIHLYEEYGNNFVHYLTGQFAIAIWDKRKHILILARDHVGICPLYFLETKDGFYFCSEIKGFLAANLLTATLNPDAMAQMIYFGTVCAPTTMFSNVSALQHAHYLTVNHKHSISQYKFWDINYPVKGDYRVGKDTKIIGHLRELIEAAVTSQMLSDVPIGNFLSGGVDSALITAIMHNSTMKLRQKITSAFSIASSNIKFTENDQAKTTSRLLKIDMKTHLVTDEDTANTFPQFIWHAETPVISTEGVALLSLAKFAKNNKSKVILTGEGADEAFGGYLAFRQFKLIGCLTHYRLGAIRKLIRPILNNIYGTECLLPTENKIEILRSHLGFIPAQMYEYMFYSSIFRQVLSREYITAIDRGCHWNNFKFDRSKILNRHWLDQSLYVGYQIMLPNYLLGPHGDRIFASNSIEGRYPFLDRKLVEYVATLHPNLKINGLKEKYVMRKAAEKWLPSDIAWRKKRRFMMPMIGPFINHHSPLINELLSAEKIEEYGYFELERVKNLLVHSRRINYSQTGAKAYLSNLALGLTLTFILSTQLWHYLFIKRISV